MAGKKKHASRSRKTARYRLRSGRFYLKGAIPVWARRMMMGNY